MYFFSKIISTNNSKMCGDSYSAASAYLIMLYDLFWWMMYRVSVKPILDHLADFNFYKAKSLIFIFRSVHSARQDQVLHQALDFGCKSVP